MGQRPQAESMDRPGGNLTMGKGNKEGDGGHKFLGSKFPEASDISTVSDPVSSSGIEGLFPWELSWGGDFHPEAGQQAEVV